MLVTDLRNAIRAMRKQPFFAAIAIATLGLGIGANTGIFSVVHTVLLEPVPYPAEEPNEVLVLAEAHQLGEMSVAYPNLKDWQRLSRSFEAMAGYRETSSNLTGLEEPLRIAVTQVSNGYFEILRVSPILGRLFAAEEDTPAGERVAVLNHALWRNRFGADPNVVGEPHRPDPRPSIRLTRREVARRDGTS